MFKEYNIPINDVELYLQVIGSGEPIVLLHGNSQSSKAFKEWVNLLSKENQVILIDSRNHGSSTNSSSISISLMANDVYKALEYLNIEKANFIGYSDGGNICLQLAVDFPEIIDKMIVISANATPSGLMNKFMFQFRIWQTIIRWLSKIKIVSIDHYNKTKLISDDPNISEADLKKIKAPTLLIYGDKDIVDEEHISYLNRAISSSELITLKNTNHFNILNKIDETSILKYLKE